MASTEGQKTFLTEKERKVPNYIWEKHLYDSYDFWEIILWTDELIRRKVCIHCRMCKYSGVFL